MLIKRIENGHKSVCGFRSVRKWLVYPTCFDPLSSPPILPPLHKTIKRWYIGLTWMDGLLRCPRLEVVWRGSWPSIMVWGLIRRKASITTFPLTLWIGSTTTATARWFRASKLWTYHRSKEIRLVYTDKNIIFILICFIL